jgi:hypothetical protein
MPPGRVAGLCIAWLSVAAVAASCGHRKGLGIAPEDDAAGGAAPDAGAPDAGPPDAGAPDAGADATYYGFVLAKLTQGQAPDGAGAAYSAFADFVKGTKPTAPPSCPDSWPSAGSCCCLRGISTPLPEQPPDAATVTIASADGANVLATLTGSRWVSSGGTVSGTLHGTWDLGLSWVFAPGDYAPVDSVAWSPGDVLRVSATGMEVGAFAGLLDTGDLLTGVTPPIGPPLVIDRAHDLDIAWTPEDLPGATVLLAIQQFTMRSTLACYCTAPDAAAKLTVSATLLADFASTDQLSAAIQLERLLVTSISGPNATIDLVGSVAQAGNISFQ